MSTDAIEKDLREEFPDATEAECRRFVEAAQAMYRRANKKMDVEKLVKAAAAEKLEEYFDWRSCYGLDFDRPAEGSDDEAIWDWAARKALSAEYAQTKQAEVQRTGTRWPRAKAEDVKPQVVDYDSFLESAMQDDSSSHADDDQHDTLKTGENSPESEPRRTLPQLIFRRKDPKTGSYLRDRKGSELIHVLPAKIDRFAAKPETWALAVSLYIDASVDRNSNYRAAIFIDARAGMGWPNPVLIMVVSLVGQVVTEIEKRHPGRCQSLLLFPLPRALTMVWGTIKGFFSPEMNEMMVVCSGPSNIGAPLPRSKLEPHVDEDTLGFLETCRTELFAQAEEQ